MVEVPAGTRPVLAGGIGDGTFILYIDGDGQFCAEVNTGTTSSGGCGAVPDAPHATMMQVGGDTLVYGTAPADAVQGEPGATVLDGYFAVPVVGGKPVPTKVTFYDAGGKVVGRAEVGA
jgi:hypothetical protein